MTGFFKRNGARLFVRLRQILAPLALGVALLGWLAAAASAQDLSSAERAELSAKRQALFDEMLRHPANLDAAFTYADISARLGDNEAAVSALERMLLFNPNLPRVDLELGALYFRMGSFAIARAYFDKALSANPPPAIRSRIEEYRHRIALEESPHHLTGYFLHGFQYQTDANVGPGSPLIHSPIGDVLLNTQFVKQNDANLFAAGALLYTYDLGTQNRDTLEIGTTGYMNKYMHVGRLDLAYGEVTAGPRFNFPDPAPQVTVASVKPYLIFNEVGLGLDQYFFTYGAGIEGTAALGAGLRLRAAFEFRQKNFTDSPDRPLSRGLNGNDKLVAIEIDKSITANSVLSFQFDFLDQQTRFAFYTNKAYAGTVGYRIQYDDPIGWLHLPWETVFFASRSWDNYAAPDPCCNTSGSAVIFSPSDRYDRRWRFGISQGIKLAADTSLILQLQRDIVSSNLPLYAYTSNSVLIGPQIRF